MPSAHDVDRTVAQSPDWPTSSRRQPCDAVGISLIPGWCNSGKAHTTHKHTHTECERVLFRQRGVVVGHHQTRQISQKSCQSVAVSAITAEPRRIYSALFYSGNVCYPQVIIAEQSQYWPAVALGHAAADGPTDRPSTDVGGRRSRRPWSRSISKGSRRGTYTSMLSSCTMTVAVTPN